MIREPFPFAEFIASEANNFGLRQLVSPGKGKTRRVDLLYTKRIPESDVLENQANPNCVATNKYGECSAEYSIDTDENVQSSENIDIADLEETCRDNGEYFMSRLMHHMDVIERKLATTITEQAVPLTGKWATSVQNVVADQLQVKTHKDGDVDTIYPYTMQQIDRAIKKTAYCNAYGIFGGDPLVDYYQLMLAGCCADQGIDLSRIMQLYGKAVMWDERVVDAMGDDDVALALQLGAVALLTYTRTPWKEGVPAPIVNSGNYVSMVATTPRLGVPVDITFKDDCGSISIVVTGTVKPVAMPDDMFPTGDKYDGVKWFNEIKVVNTP